MARSLKIKPVDSISPTLSWPPRSANADRIRYLDFDPFLDVLLYVSACFARAQVDYHFKTSFHLLDEDQVCCALKWNDGWNVRLKEKPLECFSGEWIIKLWGKSISGWQMLSSTAESLFSLLLVFFIGKDGINNGQIGYLGPFSAW